MNIHPLVVHFPIALLTLYSALEVLRRFTKQDFWKPLRAFLVIVGAIGAFASLQTGEIAEQAYGEGMRNVLEMHKVMATVTTYVYALLAVLYGIDILESRGYLKSVTLLSSIKKTVLNSPLADLLAIIGFATLGLVGALGGILVYGPDADFATSIVYKMLF
jgi:uncharacterized membrane protein